MLSPTAEFVKWAGRTTLAPVFRVALGGAVGSSDHIAEFVAAMANVADAPAAVIDVASLSHTIDPKDGTSSTGEISVTLLNVEVVREVINANRLIGKYMLIDIGFLDPTTEALPTGWASGDWLAFFRGPIKSMSYGSGGQLKLTATTIDVFRSIPLRQALARFPQRGPLSPATYGGGSSSASYTFFDEHAIASTAHPLDLCYDLLESANIPTAYIDSSSFDPADAANDDIVHFKTYAVPNVRGDARILTDPGAIELAKRIVWLCGGAMLINEDGVISFKFIDPTAATVGTFDGNQIIADTLTITQEDSDIIGRVNVQCCFIADGSEGSAEPECMFTLEARNTQDNWGRTTATTTYVPYSYELREDLLSGCRGSMRTLHGGSGAFDIAESTMVSDVEPTMTNAQYNSNKGGFCGHLASGQEADSDHPVRIYLSQLSGRKAEIVEAELTLWNGLSSFSTRFNTITSLHGDSIYSTTVNASSATAYDVTIPYFRAKRLLEQYAEPTEIVTFETGWLPGADGNVAYQYQVGDVVALDHDQYIAYGTDGTPSGSKFLVEGKSATFTGRFQWRLRRLRTTAVSLTVPGMNYNADLDNPSRGAFPGAKRDLGGLSSAVLEPSDGLGFGAVVTQDGMHGTTSSTLTATIAQTRGYMGGRYRSSGPIDRTYSASKDTYIWLIYNANLTPYAWFAFEEKTNKAAPPSAPATSPEDFTGALSKPFYRVRTDGTEVTEVVDLTPTGFVTEESCDPSQKMELHRKERTTNHWSAPLVTANASGLVVDLVSATAAARGERLSRTLDESKTLTATKATFVYLSSASSIAGQGTYVTAEATIGAGEPSTYFADPDYTLVGVIETDGSSIVEVRDWSMMRGGGSAALIEPGTSTWPPNRAFEAWGEDGNPVGWSLTTGGSGVMTYVCGDDQVKCGRSGLQCKITGASDTCESYSDAFPVNGNLDYTVQAILHVSTNGTKVTVQLQFLDADYAELAKRNITSAESIGVTGADGALREATLSGIGAGATQIPSGSRFARVRLYIEADTGEAYNQECTFSLVTVKSS